MTDYQLESDEVLLMELEASVETSFSKSKAHEIALTNRHIVIPYKGFFDKLKEIKKIPLSSINIFQGKVAIAISEKLLEDTEMDINLKNGRLHITVSEDKKKCHPFVNQINNLVCGADYEFESHAIPGMEGMADALKGTVDAFKKSFGFGPQKQISNCVSCNAQIAGEKGQVVYCRYCGSANRL